MYFSFQHGMTAASMLKESFQKLIYPTLKNQLFPPVTRWSLIAIGNIGKLIIS